MSNIGKIFICSTPIGNLSDISAHLSDALSSADTIFAEDTRVTSKLLAHLELEKPLKRLDENVMDKHVTDVIDAAKAGEIVAYCSDAGTPGVSDPGLKIVEAARQANIDVEVVPGPSAVLAAYVASGFTNQNFYFGGFLPRKDNARKNELDNLSKLDAVLIFYESPNRLVKTLETIAEVFVDTPVSVCRELTKMHEEVAIGPAGDVYEEFKQRESIKGEIVICVDSKPVEAQPEMDPTNKLANYLSSSGFKSSEISSVLQDVFGVSKNDAYQIALNAKE